MQRCFFKRMNAQQLQSSVQCSGQVQLLVNDGDHQVSGDGHPDLGLHRVGARAEVMLDSQVPFDPAEEQFDAPPQTINQGHRQCRDFEMVGQKDQIPSRPGIEVMHLSQQGGKGGSRSGQSGFSNLVAANARRGIHRQRSLTGETQVVFGPRDEERSGSGDPVQTLEIHIAAIDHIEGPRLEAEFVEPANVVLPGVGDVNAGGNRATQIDLGVDFDARLGAAKVGPGEISIAFASSQASTIGCPTKIILLFSLRT